MPLGFPSVNQCPRQEIEDLVESARSAARCLKNRLDLNENTLNIYGNSILVSTWAPIDELGKKQKEKKAKEAKEKGPEK